jgi:hypothetical protein
MRNVSILLIAEYLCQPVLETKTAAGRPLLENPSAVIK